MLPAVRGGSVWGKRNFKKNFVKQSNSLAIEFFWKRKICKKEYLCRVFLFYT